MLLIKMKFADPFRRYILRWNGMKKMKQSESGKFNKHVNHLYAESLRKLGKNGQVVKFFMYPISAARF